MKSILFFLFILNVAAAQTKDSSNKPTLFSNLGESICTPDGMAINEKGELFLSVPNFQNHEQYGSKICKFNSKNQPIVWLDNLPRHELTNKSFPMGMAFGSDGNLYVADNQSSSGKLYQSRLLRIIIKKGIPIKVEVVVVGFNVANGVRSYKNRIYVTDSYFYSNTKTDQSGVYSFDINELKDSTIQLKPNPEDPHVLCAFTTKLFNGKHNQGGADGLTFDKEGSLYVGNFGDGVISKIELTADGKFKSQKIIVDSENLRCCDGICYSEKTNSIYIANFTNNSIHELFLKNNELKLLWENGDDNGSGGLLDQPCEPILFKGKLLVVNFDSFKGTKNSETDNFHTISSFKLK